MRASRLTGAVLIDSVGLHRTFYVANASWVALDASRAFADEGRWDSDLQRDRCVPGLSEFFPIAMCRITLGVPG